MTQAPQSQRYMFDELVTENDLTQSWIATHLDNSRKCFVKVPSDTGTISKSDKISFLKTSFDCQRQLRSHTVLRASARHKENRTLFIEYPYLDGSVWQVISPELLARYFESVLPEVCVLMDYIHLIGLIHGDAKLDNYLINLSRPQPRLVLADLDFLRPAGQELTAKVFGTPEFIAPEVLANEEITEMSDNYSLGLSLRAHLEAISDAGLGESDLNVPDPDKIHDFVARLTARDPSNRPRFLTDALRESGLISESAFKSLNHRLLCMQLLARYCTFLSHRTGGQKRFRRFLVELNKVHGVPDEFLDDLEAMHHKDRMRTFELATNLLANARVERYADYWHVALSDDQFAEAYSSLRGMGMDPDVLPVSFHEVKSADDFSDRRNKAASLADRGYHLKALVSLKAAEDALLSADFRADSGLKASLYAASADVSAALGRADDAGRYYELASTLTDGKTEDYLRLIRDAAFQRILLRRLDDAMRLLETGLVQAEALQNRTYILELRRLQAFVAGVKGKPDEARAALTELLNQAVNSADKLLQLRILNNIGTNYWRSGNFSEAREYCSKSVDIATSEDLLADAIQPLGNLCTILYELLEYDEAIRFGKLASKSLTHPSDHTSLPTVCRNIAYCYARLGHYQKARYWQQRYISGQYFRYDEYYFGAFLCDSGWIAFTEGYLPAAKDTLLKAAQLLESRSISTELRNTYFVLAQIAFYRAESDNFERYWSRAKAVSEELGAETSLIELGLLRAVYDLCYGAIQPEEALIPAIQKVTERHSYHFAGEGLFHLLVRADSNITHADLEALSPLIDRIAKSNAPVCRAASQLVAFAETPESDKLKNLHLLKTAYKTLQFCGHTLFMMLVSERIADCYLAASRESLAKPFLLNAQKLADGIGNRIFVQSLERKIESITQDQSEKRKMVQTIFSISSILQNIHSYEDTLNELVEYAVETTGAERGALLLSHKDSADVHLKAYLNCDDDSLKDIVDFSRNVVQSVVESEHPLIIDNALDDKRTKGYKSIVAHNILSVICIPVYRGDDVLGVLYLDHHTIPALFTEEDIEFIRAMANFISHVATVAKDFRTASIVSDEYLRELRMSGVHQPFITENATMLSLLRDLPAIARSEASVLIVGESGTGKEILCELVHALSRRADQPLVKLNCAAIPSQEIESELFGVARNAFTGVDEREGKFSAADGGTLFLDEIGDMPLAIQGKILRVLEYQEFEKRGSNRTVTTDVRFIYATNKNLEDLVKQGRFREDLFYRVNRIIIEIPPLRERLDDVPALIDHFAGVFSPNKREMPGFLTEAVEALMRYRWPGNVRELRNLVERFCIKAPGKTVGITDLPRLILDSICSPEDSKEVSESLEKALIRQYLKEFEGNKSKVAAVLSIPLTTLRRKIKRYGLDG